MRVSLGEREGRERGKERKLESVCAREAKEEREQKRRDSRIAPGSLKLKGVRKQ